MSAKHTTPIRGIRLIVWILILVTISAGSQVKTGYIYVHSKVLNEANSPSITYSVTGRTTSVPPFSLNDNPAQTIIIGSAQCCRLSAVSYANGLYYHDTLSQ
jgi:hypothetical protein